MSEIAFRYEVKKNKGGSYIPGVPLRDLTAAEVAALRPNLGAAVEAAPFYVKVSKGSKTAVKAGANLKDKED